MSNKAPVIAAIPNYNMAPELDELLPQVLGDGYDAVYVMDDASTDHSIEVVESYGKDVRLIMGSENVGSGGNRNRLLGVLGRSCIIHFLDADVTLNSDDNPARLREYVATNQIGFIGGLVTEPDGQQMIWNYGPRQSLYADIGANVQMMRKGKHNGQPGKLLRAWPDVSVSPQPRTVYWSSEANLAIHSLQFERLQGFDAKLREHDIQDLAIRAQRLGLINRFEPTIAVTHHGANVRNYNRQLAMLRAEAYIARKHGVRNWLLPGGHLRPLSNEA